MGYNVAAYIGQGLFDASVSPTNPGTGAYVYTYADTSTAGVQTLHTPQTYSFEYGNSRGSNSKFPFGTITDYSLTISQTACDYTISGFGAYPTKNISMTASPTYVAPNLMSYTDCRISFATTFSSLSSGKLLTGKSVVLNTKNRFKAQFFIDDATISIGGILEDSPENTGTIVVAEGTESDLFLSALETSTMFWLQLKATGPLIVAGTPNYYNSYIDTWACYMDSEEEGNSDDLFTGTYQFHMAEDVTNNDRNLVITNTIATL
jgi:hypothetical protein